MRPGDFVSVLSHGLLLSPVAGSNATGLNHSPADVLAQLLRDLGLGTDPEDSGAWPVFTDSEPSAPDGVITVYDTQGRQNGCIQPSGEIHEYPGLQVRVRSAVHTLGFVKANAIRVALDESIYESTVYLEGASYLVHSVERTGGILRLGKVDSSRSVFTINCLATLRQL